METPWEAEQVFSLPTDTNPGVYCQAGGFWWQSIPAAGSRHKFTGAFVHFFCLPSAPGTSSTFLGNYQTVPEHRAMYLLRACRIMFKKMPGSRSILLERPGRQSWFPRGAVPAPGAMASLVFLLLELSVSPAAQRQLLPQIGVPPQCHIVPQHCFCIKATSLHSNLKYGIRSKDRKVAIHRRLYLSVTTEIQRCRIYLTLCVGTMRHQTLTIHTTNRKL